MFWMNLLKNIFSSSDCECEKNGDSIQLILVDWGVEREILPPEYSFHFNQSSKS